MQIARLRFRRPAKRLHGTNFAAAFPINAVTGEKKLVVAKLEMAGSNRLP
jgi:hypothetical protein